MRDLEIAKKKLYENNLTLVIVKNEKVIFQTEAHRISGFLRAIEQKAAELQGAVVADKVAGKALALLCVYSGIKQVYAEILSRKAQVVFEENCIGFEWKEIVDNVLDINKSSLCPFEQVVAEISNPKESYSAFKDLLDKMKQCR
ncbi:MAG: DUF1893 domain-containing protein [Ignavibacteria bacterium]